MREVIVEIGDVATVGECRVDECETGVWKGEICVGERQVFKKEVDE